MTTKREKLEKKVREKHGRIYGEELKVVVTDHFSKPWGPRYLRRPVNEPSIEHLTPNVLRGLLKD